MRKNFLFAAAAAQPSWIEHSDVLVYLIGGLFTMVAFFMIRTIKKIDANQSLLFDKLDHLSRDFYQLKGEHEALKSNHRMHHKE